MHVAEHLPEGDVGTDLGQHIVADRWHIDRIGHSSFFQVVRHLLGNGDGHILLGFTGRGAQVRGTDKVVQTKQRARFQGGRFLGKDIQGRTADLVVAQCLVQGCLIAYPAAGTIDEHCICFHIVEKFGGNKIFGLLGQGYMNRNHITSPGQFEQIHQFNSEFFGYFPGHMRIKSDGLHLQSLGPARRNAAYSANADNPECFSGEFMPHEFFLIPPAGLHGSGGLGDIAGQ